MIPSWMDGDHQGEHMSTIVVLGFGDDESARAFKPALEQLVEEGVFALADAVLVTVSDDGTPKSRPFFSTSKVGAVTGGVLGGLVGLLFLSPVAGAAIGAASGVALGRPKDEHGIEQEFIAQTTAALKPGATALILEVTNATPGAIEKTMQDEGLTIITMQLDKETRDAWSRVSKATATE